MQHTDAQFYSRSINRLWIHLVIWITFTSFITTVEMEAVRAVNLNKQKEGCWSSILKKKPLDNTSIFSTKHTQKGNTV